MAVSQQTRALEKKALTSLIVGAIVIALAPIFVRLSEVDPIATAFYRMALALPFFVMWGLVSQSKGVAIDWRKIALPKSRLTWVAGFCFAGDLALWHWSIHYTSVANATLMANLAPIFVTLFAFVVLRHRFKWSFIFGIAAALLGAVLLIQGGLSFGTGSLLGDGLGIATAMFYAGYIIAVSELRKSESTFSVMLSTTWVSSLFLLPLMVMTESQFVPNSSYAWMVLILLALLPQCLGQGLIAFGMAHLPAAYSSISLLVQPVAAALLAWSLLNEGMGPVQIVGAVVVLAAITFCHRSRRTLD